MQSVVTEKARWQEPKAAGHIECTVRKQRTRERSSLEFCMLFVFVPFVQSWDLCPLDGAAHIQNGSSL